MAQTDNYYYFLVTIRGVYESVGISYRKDTKKVEPIIWKYIGVREFNFWQLTSIDNVEYQDATYQVLKPELKQFIEQKFKIGVINVSDKNQLLQDNKVMIKETYDKYFHAEYNEKTFQIVEEAMYHSSDMSDQFDISLYREDIVQEINYIQKFEHSRNPNNITKL